MASRGLRKNIFFSILGSVRGETLIFVCSYGCVVGPLKTDLYKLNGGRRRAVGPSPASLRTTRPPVTSGPTTHP